MIAIFLGIFFLIISNKQNKHNALSEFKKAYNYYEIEKMNEQGKINEKDYWGMQIAALHTSVKLPRLKEDKKERLPDNVINAIKEYESKLPSAVWANQNDDLTNRPIERLLAEKADGIKFTFYTIAFLAFILILMYISIFKSEHTSFFLANSSLFT